ncbi:MAG: tripartite tricarboxylate transporter TctB family protein [Desulfobacterota bacterium]|nr:tripartite tricarboxylate transporter TctB family protein [Thermodesulfobacteriota bacterium]MDW8001910.1 tripartite tricarboxylate transporter TctB family protein [Deltaproteobacteria bacterium]
MKKGQIASLLFLLVGIYVLYVSFKLKIGFSSPGPGFLPFFSSSILIILSVVLYMKSKADEVPIYWKRPVLVFTLLFTYALVLELLGFLVATILFMIFIFALCGFKLPRSVIYSLSASFLSYIVFKILLQVPLPRGSLFGG